MMAQYTRFATLLPAGCGCVPLWTVYRLHNGHEQYWQRGVGRCCCFYLIYTIPTGRNDTTMMLCDMMLS